MSKTSMAIQRLLGGEPVEIRVTGSSMAGRIESGSTVRIAPVRADEEIDVGDIVLCRVHGSEYLHLVSAARDGDMFQISNTRGHMNGWTNRRNIFGKFTGTVN